MGPMLKQLDAEYEIPAEQVPFLANFLKYLAQFSITMLCFLQQQDGPEPTHEDGSPFAFLPPAPVPLFCKDSTPLKKVVMQSQPISPKSAPKSKAASGLAAPRASTRVRTAVRKVAARKTSERPSPVSAQKSLQAC